MNVNELDFDRPSALAARNPPEARGIPRDGVRLLVGTPSGSSDAKFIDLPSWLAPGDLLVTNRSQVVAASLPARGTHGPFRLSVSASFGRGTYLVEPRHSFSEPGPLPIHEGEEAAVGRTVVRFVAQYPGIPRLWFVHADRPLEPLMDSIGSPIRYGYLDRGYPLSYYETIFGRIRGSAEMPSAGRPFTPRLVRALKLRGVRFASVLLHAGVSSVELEGDRVEEFPSTPEAFEVPASAVDTVAATRRRGHRVIAVGTTVVRALESAWSQGELRPTSGFTRQWVTADHGIHTVDGILTGFHDARTTHLAMLFALVGSARLRAEYRAAVAGRYLWHEFGDAHLLLNS